MALCIRTTIENIQHITVYDLLTNTLNSNVKRKYYKSSLHFKFKKLNFLTTDVCSSSLQHSIMLQGTQFAPRQLVTHEPQNSPDNFKFSEVPTRRFRLSLIRPLQRIDSPHDLSAAESSDNSSDVSNVGAEVPGYFV
ncbi:hypothetical protein AVEN_269089-1 [Araneus ventricosus]|uniref:Uncharacterized protein n=1 Tax=Araneus ventricosus TaxID=182803 RepID=A0A4Y2JKG3_ARAVE|nr:hypothetical protein AVEN_269089-1 [Araneus ventricosus]